MPPSEILAIGCSVTDGATFATATVVLAVPTAFSLSTAVTVTVCEPSFTYTCVTVNRPSAASVTVSV